MKKRLILLYDRILGVLPAKYHRPAEFFYSEKKMVERAAKLMGVSYERAKDYLNSVVNDDNYGGLEALGSLPRKYRLKNGRSIVGLSFPSQILINCYGLRRETENVCKFVILHELGHSSLNSWSDVNHDEILADKFALRWSEKII